MGWGDDLGKIFTVLTIFAVVGAIASAYGLIKFGFWIWWAIHHLRWVTI